MQKTIEYETIRVTKVKRKNINQGDEEIPYTEEIGMRLRGRGPLLQEFFEGENPLENFWATERFRFVHKLDGRILLQRCYRNSHAQIVWVDTENFFLIDERDEQVNKGEKA